MKAAPVRTQTSLAAALAKNTNLHPELAAAAVVLPPDVPYKAAFEKVGKTCPQITAKMLAAQARIESVNFDRAVISGRRKSPAGAIGISQFMPTTAKSWGVDPYDPESSIAGQARLMCALTSKYGDYAVSLAAYNAGEGAVKKYQGIPPYKETRTYIKRIKEQL